MLRNEKGTRKRGWILKNTGIDPVLNIKACRHEDRFSIEVQIPSSWVGVVNGVDKYVTESRIVLRGNPC